MKVVWRTTILCPTPPWETASVAPDTGDGARGAPQLLRPWSALSVVAPEQIIAVGARVAEGCLDNGMFLTHTAELYLTVVS